MRTACGILIVVLAAAAAAAIPARAADPPLYHAGLVVRLSADQVLTRCVAFDELQISGAALLERSGLALETITDPALGASVCQIADVGCPASQCFCAYPPAYWQYWLQQDSSWRFSSVGASTRMLADGAVDGWIWGGAGAAPLPALEFDQICLETSENQLWLPLIER
ncbi:MAG: hypothetical protein HGA65_04500 [Oscillochloris sp.]|nr:hypothetical protein [Oscillochloris sp.]